MTRIGWTVAFLIVAVIGVGGWYVLSQKEPVVCTADAKICPDGSAVGRQGPLCEFAACPEVQNISYATSTYNIAFTYPNHYSLEEREVGDAHRGRYFIALMQKKDLPLPQGGEGPPAITVDIFQNNLDKQSVENWIKNSNPSNYKLSPDGVFASTTVDGAPALHYRWDGLYNGQSIVFAHKDTIIMVSVTSLTPDDQTLKDFPAFLSSIDLR